MQKRVVKQSVSLVPVEIIQNKIYLIRGKKVMFDKDLAELYQVETKQLNRGVKRHITRFPEDFCFQITNEELNSSRCQIGTLNRGGNIKYLPYVFTELGVAMLSSVLNSNRAIEVNIQIMRIFTKLREMIAGNKELVQRINEMERKFREKFKDQDEKIQLVFDAIGNLLEDKEEGRKRKAPMGFVVPKQSIKDLESKQKQG